jgi:hypothetical protein
METFCAEAELQIMNRAIATAKTRDLFFVMLTPRAKLNTIGTAGRRGRRSSVAHHRKATMIWGINLSLFSQNSCNFLRAGSSR